jgi:hypothetical protein
MELYVLSHGYFWCIEINYLWLAVESMLDIYLVYVIKQAISYIWLKHKEVGNFDAQCKGD